MMKKEDAPWVDYLNIDEKTGDRKLNANAPNEVKKAYKEYQQKLQKYVDDGKPIPK